MANWKGKRFVPFDDEVLWRGNNARGVYDTLKNTRVISFSYSVDATYDGLREKIAERMNNEVPDSDTDRQHKLAEQIFEEITGVTYYK
jgi:hypothetical protein